MQKTNQNLGRAVGQILKIMRGIDAAFDDIDAFGAPAECGRAIDAGAWLNAKRIIRAAGFKNARRFMAAVERRVSYKWIYQSGLGWIMEDHRVRPLSRY